MIPQPGYKTTEALATALTALGALVAALAGHLSPKWAAIASSVSVGCYAISRGLTKLGAHTGTTTIVQPTTPGA